MQYGPQYGHGYAFPHPAPPDPPERPEGIPGFPRWPAWYGPAAFGTGLVVAAVLAAVVGAVAGGELGTTATIVLTVILDAVFVAVAILFASMTERPRAHHFGLRRAPFWRTLGWAALGMVSFYVVAAIYSALVDERGEQTVLEELGAKDSDLTLLAVALLVIVVAPAAEEFFFRGFFYRALRTRMPILVAALLDGVLFGLIHYEGPDSLVLLPVLATLGVVFCLVYERTGTLFAPIGLHAFNNIVAYGAGTDAWAIAGSVGAVMLTACVVIPRTLARTPAHA